MRVAALSLESLGVNEMEERQKMLNYEIFQIQRGNCIASESHD